MGYRHNNSFNKLIYIGKFSLEFTVVLQGTSGKSIKHSIIHCKFNIKIIVNQNNPNFYFP